MSEPPAPAPSRGVFSFFNRPRASPSAAAGPSRRESPPPRGGGGGPSRQRSRSGSPVRRRIRLSPPPSAGPARVGGVRALGGRREREPPAPPRQFSESEDEGEARRAGGRAEDGYEALRRSRERREEMRVRAARPAGQSLSPEPPRRVNLASRPVRPRHASPGQRLRLAVPPIIDSDDDDAAPPPPAGGVRGLGLPRRREARVEVPAPERRVDAGSEAARRHREEARAAVAAGLVDEDALAAERVVRQLEAEERQEQLNRDAERRAALVRERNRAVERQIERDARGQRAAEMMAEMNAMRAGAGVGPAGRARLDQLGARFRGALDGVDYQPLDWQAAMIAAAQPAAERRAQAMNNRARPAARAGGGAAAGLGMPGMPGGGGVGPEEFVHRMLRIGGGFDFPMEGDGGGGQGGLFDRMNFMYGLGGGRAAQGPSIEEQWRDIEFAPRSKAETRIGFSYNFDKDVEDEVIGIDMDDEEPKEHTNLVCAKCFSTLRVSQGQRSLEDRVISLECGHLVDQKCLDILSKPPPDPPVGAEDVDHDTHDEEFQEENEEMIQKQVDALGGGTLFDAVMDTGSEEGGKRATRSQTRNGMARLGSQDSTFSSLAGGSGVAGRKRAAPTMKGKPAKKAKVVKKVMREFQWMCPVSTCERVHVSKLIGGVWKPKEGSVVPLFI